MEKIVSKNEQKTTKLKYEGDETYIVTEQKVDHILDDNKKKANAYEKGKLIGNTQKHHQHVANIPVTLYYELLKRFGQPAQNLKAWKKYLNDPDNRYLRTGGGKL
tara:strand:- start:106 stop:420 length:315 start_codon:yes stop_codon:yes gene_type:complete